MGALQARTWELFRPAHLAPPSWHGTAPILAPYPHPSVGSVTLCTLCERLVVCTLLPQDHTTNDFKLEPQSDDGTLDSKYGTTTHDNSKNGATQLSVTLSEMPAGDHLLAAKPGAGGAGPPQNDQVKTTERTETRPTSCGRDKVWLHLVMARALFRPQGPWLGPRGHWS